MTKIIIKVENGYMVSTANPHRPVSCGDAIFVFATLKEVFEHLEKELGNAGT